MADELTHEARVVRHNARLAKLEADRAAAGGALTLEQLGYRITWASPDGRIWGIKIFRFREHDLFYAGLQRAIGENTTIVWSRWLQTCLEDYRGDYCGPWIKARRALGLRDYSLAQIIKRCGNNLPAFRDAVCKANIGQGFTEFMDKLNDAIKKERGKKKPTGGNEGYGGVIGTLFLNKGILPEEFLNFTQPQWNAINAVAESESRKSGRSSALDAARIAAGMEEAKRW